MTLYDVHAVLSTQFPSQLKTIISVRIPLSNWQYKIKMAEDETLSQQSRKSDEDEADEEAVKDRINKDRLRQDRKKNSPKCRTRVDTLATPNRRLILDLYQRHAYHLSKDKVEKIKELLQELYAMTPEETNRYFMELEQENRKKDKRKRLKELLRKEYAKQRKQQNRAKAYKIFRNILRKSMMFSMTHAVPSLVSVRLRNLSDIVLEQICDLRNTTKPDRDDPDKEGRFLIAVADWIAVGIEQIYFEVQVKKNEELKKLEKEKEHTDNADKKSVETPQVTNETRDKSQQEKEWANETDENQWED